MILEVLGGKPSEPPALQGPFGIMDVPSVEMKCVHKEYHGRGTQSVYWGEASTHTSATFSLYLSPCLCLCLSVHLSQSLSLWLYLSLTSPRSFSLTQNIQAQLNVTMTAVAITLVSHESLNSQAQGEDSSDPTVGIGYNYALWV